MGTEAVPGSIPDQENSIKLSKMSKGYNWEIKVYQKSMSDDELLRKIAFFDTKLELTWGNK